jgi:hypothetical protein
LKQIGKCIILLVGTLLVFSIQVFATKEPKQETTYTITRVEIYDGNKLINYDSAGKKEKFPIAWINGTPKMPEIKIVFVPEDIPCKVSSKLFIHYDRENRNLYDQIYFPLAINKQQWQTIAANSSKEWSVDLGENFIGGTADVIWELYSKENKLITNGKETFYIRGHNPTDALVTQLYKVK